MLPLSTGRKVHSEGPDAPCCLISFNCQGFALLGVLWVSFFQHQVLIDLRFLGTLFCILELFYNTCTLLKASNLTAKVIRKYKWHHADNPTIYDCSTDTWLRKYLLLSIIIVSYIISL